MTSQHDALAQVTQLPMGIFESNIGMNLRVRRILWRLTSYCYIYMLTGRSNHRSKYIIGINRTAIQKVEHDF